MIKLLVVDYRFCKGKPSNEEIRAKPNNEESHNTQIFSAHISDVFSENISVLVPC